MRSSRLYDKAMTIFGATMIFFYFGLAYLLLFSPIFSHIEMTIRVIFSVPLFIYGSFRTVVAYQKIKKNFFETDDE